MRELHCGCCRHCGGGPVTRPRGLCWTCYYTVGVREQYPSESRWGKRGVGHPQDGRSLPAEPTQARPGSEEKVAVLEQRAARGETLWHYDDNPGDGCQLLMVPGDGRELPPEGCRPNSGEEPTISRDVPRLLLEAMRRERARNRAAASGAAGKGGEAQERPIVVLIAEE